MPLKDSGPNPLVVFGMRRMDFCPPHFEPVYFDCKTSPKVISDWVWERLSGRFYFGDYYTINENGSSSMCQVIAFEEAAEASYFCLYLDTINQFPSWT